MEKSLRNFSVQVYGELTPRNETTSIGRCRIFYKGLNRNGSFITNEFAEKLLATLPYTPIKGIYNPETQDYTTHGSINSEGRIYGIVPENPNLAWEDHLDEDGVNRTYACCDVLVYTALYEEAGQVLFKPESMELYPPSIKGDWIYVDGQKVFQFTDACFFGLQVLGDEVEPCFEGAAFFTLNDKVEKAFEKLKALEAAFELEEQGGKVEMQKMNFKLSEGNEIYQKVFELLNPNFTEEGNWEVNYMVCNVADEYALVMNYETGNFEQIKIKKIVTDSAAEGAEGNKENEGEEGAATTEETFELGETSTCYMITVSESEKTSLEAVQQLNGGSFDKIEEVFAKVPELENRIAEIESKNSTCEQELIDTKEQFTTLQAEKDELAEKFNNLQTEKDALDAQIGELNEYKLATETAKKQAIINKYAAQLDADIMSNYSATAEITVEELERNLAFELVKATPSLFSNQEEEEEGYVPKDVNPSGLEAILTKYKK